MNHHQKLVALAYIPVVALIGCGTDTPEFPDVAPVTGTVTHQGDPVEGASVRFVPKTPGEDSFPAMATSDAEGTYTLSTTFSPSVTKEGAVPGNYSVVVIKKTKVQVDPNAAHDENLVKQRPKHLLPQEFSAPSSSPLDATVKSGQDNQIPLDLGA